MERSKNWYLFIGLFIGVILFGCATKGPILGKEKIIERSWKKGDWVSSENRSFKKDKLLFFRGQTTGVPDLTLGMRQAEADAKKRIIGKIAELVEAEYSDYAVGANMSEGDKGRFVADGIAWVSDSILISGAESIKTYWEKIEVTRDYGVGYLYNIYTLVQIPEKDYMKARDNAIHGLIGRAKEARNKKAEEAAKKLIDKLERGELE